MTALSTDLRSSLADLQTRHADLITAVSGYKDGSLGRAIADVQAANQAVTARLDAEESAILGLAALKSAKPQPSLCLDFVEQKYLRGTRRLEKGYGLKDIITFTRASGGGRFNAQGQYEWLPADQPRIDYDPVTGECRGLLVEESRTNLLLRSSEFDNAEWAKAGSLTLTAVPDGVAPAYAIAFAADYAYVFGSRVSTTAGQVLTASVFARKNSGRFTLRISNSPSTQAVRAVVDTIAGTITAGRSTSGTVLGVTRVPAGPDYDRYVLVGSLANAEANSVSLMLVREHSSQVGATVRDAQLEVGSFPTSYIPTTSSQVTRAADIASVNELSPWYNASEGALFVEFSLLFPWPGNAHQHVVALSNGGFNNYIAIRKQFGGAIRGQVVVGGAVQFDGTAGSATSQTMKAAVAYKVNDFAMTQNGLPPAIDVSGTIPTVTKLDIGRLSGAGQEVNGHIQSLKYYPRRLSNDELQAITS